LANVFRVDDLGHLRSVGLGWPMGDTGSGIPVLHKVGGYRLDIDANFVHIMSCIIIIVGIMYFKWAELRGMVLLGPVFNFSKM
jgi:hypothetical protein